MDAKRRKFVSHIPLIGAVLSQWNVDWTLTKESIIGTSGVNWDEVRNLFPVSKWDKIHFNSGSAGVMPLPVQDHLIDLIKYMNQRAPYEAWNDWQVIKKENLTRLAHMLNTTAEEIQVVRNTTEALNMIIYGLPLEADDEVIVAEHDYPFALNAYENRATKDKIKIKFEDD